MNIIRTVTGTTEPVTLTLAKAFLRMEATTADDTLITALCTAAREQAERFCNRSFIAQTIEYYETVPADEIETYMEFRLPYPNHIAITEVKVNGVATTAFTQTGLNKLVVSYQGLTVGTDGNNATFYVKYTAGDCIESVKTAIKNIIKEMYFNRSDQEISENALVWLLPHKSYV